MDWVGDADTTTGVVERPFRLTVDDRVVPGILWLPAADPSTRPLVLVGHGATLHKRIDYIVHLAHLLVRHHGFAVAAIDSPGHGDRGTDQGADEVQLFANFLAEWSRPGSTDDAVAEWQATLAALR